MRMNIRNRLHIATFSENAINAISDWEMGMEINHTCISEMLDDEKRGELIKSIREDIEKSGATNLVMHGPFTEIHPAAIDYKVRELGMERLNQAYLVCSELGVKKMVVHTGWLPFIYFKEYQAEKAAKFWQSFMANKPQDFEIYIENVLEDEPYMILDMMEKIKDPRIHLCLDTGHMNAMMNDEYDIEDWFKVLSPYIEHFHLHNNDGENDSHSPLGEGSMDFDEIFELINQYCDDDATITIEARDAESCLEWLLERRYI